MKRILLTLFVFYSLAVNAQQYQALDFFLPKQGINKSTLINPGVPDFESQLWYIREQDTLYTVQHHLVAKSVVSNVTKAYVAEGPILRVIWQLRTDMFDANKPFFYRRNTAFLKIPSDEPVTWYYRNVKNEKIKCTAKLSQKVIDQDTLKSVEVYKIKLKGKKEKRKWTEYYVLGMGYVGRDENGSPKEDLHSIHFDNRGVEALRGIVLRDRPHQ